MTDISGQNDKVLYTIYSKEKFGVTATGELHAQNAWIGGTVQANKGKISNWYISEGGITNSENFPNFWLIPDGKGGSVNNIGGLYSIYVKGKFGITPDGVLRAVDADISGTINAADGGTIGNIKIENGGLTVNKTDSTELRLKQTIKHSTTKISNTAVKIYNWGTGTRSVKYYQINKTSTVNFSVKTKSGDGWTLIAIMDTLPTGNTASHPCTKVITAKSGTHLFEMMEDQYVLLSYDSFEPTWNFNDTGFSISSNGIIQANSLIVKKLQLDGTIVASDSATIAGWTINNSGLYSGDFSLTPNGEQGYLFQCGNNFNIKADGTVGIGPDDTWTITDTRIKTEKPLGDVSMVFPSGPQEGGLPVGGTYLGYLQCPGLLDETYPQAFLGIRRTTKNAEGKDVYDYPLFISYTGLIKASTVVFHNEYANEPSKVLVFNDDKTVTWKQWNVPW